MNGTAFFPRYELQCGLCGYVAWSKVQSSPGIVHVRCLNRGCEAHGKVFEVKCEPMFAKEVDGGRED